MTQSRWILQKTGRPAPGVIAWRYVHNEYVLSVTAMDGNVVLAKIKRSENDGISPSITFANCGKDPEAIVTIPSMQIEEKDIGKFVEVLGEERLLIESAKQIIREATK